MDRFESLGNYDATVREYLILIDRYITKGAHLSKANMAFLTLGSSNPVEKTSNVKSTIFATGSVAVGLHHV
ncbi:hypothetical protein BDZ94DRAFT_1264794 [Collybia nuda]|uniref:Uncharacterized protein n=1 Tax=Collybia nuda TaxID=64659 RepID=A0A9P5Y277_9AGAR|nr:hypothetical protein BDZ94DRAFT_1264794 [Collybia nuda]